MQNGRELESVTVTDETQSTSKENERQETTEPETQSSPQQRSDLLSNPTPGPDSDPEAESRTPNRRLGELGLLHMMMGCNIEEFLRKVPFLAKISERQLHGTSLTLNLKRNRPQPHQP